MPELRQNVITKEWVVISTERAKRPDQLKEPDGERRENLPEFDPGCPFCTDGAEKDICTLPAECGKVRVVANKFPALIEKNYMPPYTGTTVFPSMEGVGRHEIIIESSVHNSTLATMSPCEVGNVIRAYIARIEALQSLPFIESSIIFRNHGSRAGASLVHPHSQIIGLPIIPRDIMTRITESIRYHVDHRECVFCRILADELDCGKRLVAVNGDFAAFVPFAAYSPFHIWIYPKKHSSDFHLLSETEIANFSTILRDVLRKLYFGLNDPDYNLIVRSAPRGYSNTAFFHWYATIVPRLTRTAGFELGSGMFINPTVPEENAEFLRGLDVK